MMFRKPMTLLSAFQRLQSERAVHLWRENTNEERRRWNTAGRVCDNVSQLSDSKYRGKGNRALRRQGIVRCRECGDCDRVDGEREIRGGVCEKCSSYYVFCSVCNCDYHDENTCRHMFWDEGGGWWDGCGTDTHPNFDHFEKPFHRFLDQFVAQDSVRFEFANELSRALQTHCYQAWESGWMFETPRFSCELNGQSRNWGCKVFDEMTEEEYEAVFLGGAWFLTLEQGKTILADLLTLSWVLSWMGAQETKRAPEVKE